MTEVIDIPDLFQQVAQKVDAALFARVDDPFHVYFDYGHYDAVNKNLVNKDGSITMKDQKFPLIWMVTPFEQRPDRQQDYYCELSGLDFLFLMNTSPDYSIKERTELIFKPRIWPILNEFKKQLVDSGLFQLLSEDAIPYDYVKDWHYQSGVNGTKNLFNECIDCTQMKATRLRVNESVPETFKIFSH